MATILIVDERPTDRQTMAKLLGGAGHRVLGAARASEALQTARAEQPDLVVASVLAPASEGPVLVHALHADAATASIPVLLAAARPWQGEARHLGESCAVA